MSGVEEHGYDVASSDPKGEAAAIVHDLSAAGRGKGRRELHGVALAEREVCVGEHRCRAVSRAEDH